MASSLGINVCKRNAKQRNSNWDVIGIGQGRVNFEEKTPEYFGGSGGSVKVELILESASYEEWSTKVRPRHIFS